MSDRHNKNLIADSEAVLKSDSSLKEQILEKIETEISNFVAVYSQDGLEINKIVEEFSTIIPFDAASQQGVKTQLGNYQSTEQITEFLVKLAKDLYEAREKQVGSEVARQMEVIVYLNTMDTLWIEHLDTMDDLRAGIGLRGYAQRDPLIEYKKEGFDLFEKLMVTIDSEVVHRIFKVAAENQQPIALTPAIDLSKAVEKHQEALDETELLEEVGQLMPSVPQRHSHPGETKIKVEGSSNDEAFSTPEQVMQSVADVRTEGATKVTVERAGQVPTEQVYDNTGGLRHKKLGRNEPCWCGSGKKYKKCHMNSDLAH